MKEHIEHLSENMKSAAEELRQCHQRVAAVSEKFQVIYTLRGIIDVLEKMDKKLDLILNQK